MEKGRRKKVDARFLFFFFFFVPEMEFWLRLKLKLRLKLRLRLGNWGIGEMGNWGRNGELGGGFRMSATGF